MKQAFLGQEDFDNTIGRLDRILSKLVLWAKDEEEQMDTPNKQTLKHHAEDMIAAGNAMLTALGKVKEEPKDFQPHKWSRGKCVRCGMLEGTEKDCPGNDLLLYTLLVFTSGMETR